MRNCTVTFTIYANHPANDGQFLILNLILSSKFDAVVIFYGEEDNVELNREDLR